MTRTQIFAGIVLLLAAAAAGYWFFLRPPEPVASREFAPPPVAQAPVAPAPPPALEPAIKHPLETPPPEPAQPLPALGDSDASVADALSGLLGAKPFAEFFDLQNLVRRIVVTVDNLPRAKLPRLMLPVKPVGGKFRVAGEGSAMVIDPENAARYAAYVRLAESVDSAKLVALYRRLYPLFQRAYVELGYPDGYFNDRLVAVIDHLLAAEPAVGPIRLVRPKIFYEFADPQLESLSAGRKLLLRIGNDNAQRIKSKLRELRAGIAAQPAPGDEPPAGGARPKPGQPAQ